MLLLRPTTMMSCLVSKGDSCDGRFFCLQNQHSSIRGLQDSAWTSSMSTEMHSWKLSNVEGETEKLPLVSSYSLKEANARTSNEKDLMFWVTICPKMSTYCIPEISHVKKCVTYKGILASKLSCAVSGIRGMAEFVCPSLSLSLSLCLFLFLFLFPSLSLSLFPS